ncbi:hypothetical protein [Halocatena halophila]|uniref:hypothetical protein n=1 Tax=Halocatena halophila TaxID=2814576 RepID=UPI002ED1EA69
MTRILNETVDKEFRSRTYDAGPIDRALFCRELAGLSWNGLYEDLSTENRSIRLGFDPVKFGPYNTAPTHQMLTAPCDTALSEEVKRTILSVSERLVEAAYENDDALDLQPPRHVVSRRQVSGSARVLNLRTNRYEPTSSTLERLSSAPPIPVELTMQSRSRTASR